MLDNEQTEQTLPSLSLKEVRKIREPLHYFWEITRGYKPFKDFISEKFGKNTELSNLTLDTFIRLFSLALDSGLKRDIVEEGKKQEGVPFLNRQGFSYFLKEVIGLKAPENRDGDFSLENSNFVIYRFDLAGIGQLDEKEGDRRINDAGRILNELHQQLNLPEGYKLYSGRYGGDEFVVALIDSHGGNADEFRKKVEGLKTELQSKFIEQVIIPIKHGQIDEITLPKDKIEQKIFLAYLNRGTVLNQEELKKEKERNGSEEKLKQLIDDSIATNIYGKDNPSLEDKINYYQIFHLELYFPISLAFELDKVSKNQVNRTKEVIGFIENFLVDPLLDKIVISRFDLLEHIKRGEFNQLFCFELKLKEVNDNFSLADGDNLIKALWRKIKEAVGEENMPFFSVGRAGPSIFLGLKKEAKISQEQLSRLIGEFKMIKSIKLPEMGFDNFVGFYQSGQIDSNKPDDEIKKMFIGVNDSWLELVCNYIKDNFEAFKVKVKEFVEKPEAFKIEDTGDFLTAYFFGKRKETRMRSVIEYLSSKQGQFNDLFNFFQSHKN